MLVTPKTWAGRGLLLGTPDPWNVPRETPGGEASSIAVGEHAACHRVRGTAHSLVASHYLSTRRKG